MMIISRFIHAAANGIISFFIWLSNIPYWASLVVQMVKNPPAVQETQVRSLCQEEPLEKEMTTHSRILAWKIPRTEEPGGLQPVGPKRVRHD